MLTAPPLTNNLPAGSRDTVMALLVLSPSTVSTPLPKTAVTENIRRDSRGSNTLSIARLTADLRPAGRRADDEVLERFDWFITILPSSAEESGGVRRRENLERHSGETSRREHHDSQR